MTKRVYWFAFTPAGTLVLETGALTEAQCIENLLRLAAYMPYKTWENFEKRGYQVMQAPGVSP